MSQQLKYAGGLQINLLGTPPSDGDIIGARQRAAAQAEGEARDERRGAIVGISLANLSVLKSGRAKAVRFSTLSALCRALQCTPDELLEYVAGDES